MKQVQDINAVLAAAEKAIFEVDTYEEEQRRAREERAAKKAKALSVIKETRPLVIQQAVNTEKDRLAAMVEENKRAVADAQAQLKAAVKALAETLPAVQTALDKVNDTYQRHGQQAEGIYGFAYSQVWDLLMMDKQTYISNYGEARAESEISRQSKQQGGALVGSLPAAWSAIATLLATIAQEPNATDKRILQALAWLVSGSPERVIPSPSDDFTPPQNYQLPNRG